MNNPGYPQRVAIETCPTGSVLVMDCRQDASAIPAGSILLARLRIRSGAGGADGGVRDAAGATALEIPVIAAKASMPMNLMTHHAVDIDVAVSCGGVADYPGDIMIGDAGGVMVMSRHLADEIAVEGEPMEQLEAFALQDVLRGMPIIGLYPPTDPDTLVRFQAWKDINP